MLKNLKSLTGHRIHAADGELGKVGEFYFDDKTWAVRYMVAETGGWLAGRKVLIATPALKTPVWDSELFPVALTKDQVRTSPDIDTKKTVTRRHEIELHKHYAWPLYWGDGFYAGSISGGMLFPPGPGTEKNGAEEEPAVSAEEAHLQSTAAVTGYRLHAADGPIGHLDDFIVNCETWAIRYLVADTGIWLPGRKVLISPHWIERVDWETAEVFTDLTREAIKASPGFDPVVPVSEDYESGLYDHYGRPKLEDAADRAAPGKR